MTIGFPFIHHLEFRTIQIEIEKRKLEDEYWTTDEDGVRLIVCRV